MYIHVNGKNIEITDAIKAYVKEKIGKVANHYDQITGIDVILSVIKNPAATGKHVATVVKGTKDKAGKSFANSEAGAKANAAMLKAEEKVPSKKK